MAKGRLPEGYISAQELIKKFRNEHPKAEISTSAQLLTVEDEAIIVVTAVVSTGEAKSSGMSQGLLLDDKATEKAESSAIRRALVNLGYDSVESEASDDDEDEKEEKEERKSRFSKSKSEEKEESEDDEDESEEEEESEEKEKPRSRFGSKSNKKSDDDEEDSEESEDDEEEGKSRFKRGSRFQRG